jgi:hypothetical protein
MAGTHFGARLVTLLARSVHIESLAVKRDGLKYSHNPFVDRGDSLDAQILGGLRILYLRPFGILFS